jgi:GNAT superfamily N-acetyltransferase
MTHTDSQSAEIESLPTPVSEADLQGLALLLVDTVETGAAVSFLSPLTLQEAEDWWHKTLSTASPKAIFLVAHDGEGIVGTVQAHPAWAPNQPHRAEIAKLMVHRRARGAGLGKRLMLAIEEEALRAGFGLLILDTKRGSTAERLYRSLGWNYVGMIPAFALDPDRSALHDDVIFYKEVNPGAARQLLRT